MSDRELLELAAKAAGIQGDWVTDYGDGYTWQGNTEGFLFERTHGGLSVWNPLVDDGDALRLAVDLKIVVQVHTAMCTARYGDAWVTEPPDRDNDRYTATRRAIVRAAAEIGKAE